MNAQHPYSLFGQQDCKGTAGPSIAIASSAIGREQRA